MPRKKKAVKKISLNELMNGKPNEANADLYKDEPVKRKHHLNNRVPRGRLVSVKGGEYKRRLSGDAAMDIKYHELAREFISNGFKQSKAFAAVFGRGLQEVNKEAHKAFNSAWMRSLILEMLRGTDGEVEDLPKEYLLEKLTKQIESNILDYVDNDGAFLNVTELKALPLFTQQIIKKLQVHTWHEPMMERDEEGDMVQVGEVRHQRVQLELYDKQKALELLARAQEWIAGKADETNIYLGADVMIAANKRVEALRRDEIEGEYENVTAD